MFCNYCAANNPDDAVYCSVCGKQLGSPSTGTMSSPPTGTGGVQNKQPSAQMVSSMGGNVGNLTSSGNAGFLIAIVSTAVALLVFFLIPYISAPFLGNLTGSQLAGYNNFLPGLGWLWLEPLAALAIIGIGGFAMYQYKKQLISPGAAGRLAIIIVVIAALSTIVQFIAIGNYSQPMEDTGMTLSSFFGAGIWLYLLATIAAGVGGVIQAVQFKDFLKS